MAVVLAAMLLFASTVTASAVSLPELDRKSSLTVAIQEMENDKPLPNAEVELYLVAEVVSDSDGDMIHQVTADFANSGFDPAVIAGAKAEDLAPAISTLTEFVSAQELAPLKKMTTGAAGVALFTDLKAGLYLVMNAKPAEGYEKAAPFLITVPLQNAEGEWVYDVDAAPKVSKVKPVKPDEPDESTSSETPPEEPDESTSSETPPEEPTSSETPPEKPDKPDKPNLPQTGQLWWPVFLMAGAGIACFAFGWTRRKHSDDE